MKRILCIAAMLLLLVLPVPVLAEGYAEVTASALNIREGAGKRFPVVGTVPAGEILIVLEEEPKGIWYYVQNRDGSIVGYTDGKHLDFLESDPLATTEPTQPMPQPVYVQVTARVLNIREGAGKSFKVVGKAKKGDTLVVVAADEESGWYLVTTEDGSVSGYASAKYLKRIDVSTEPADTEGKTFEIPPAVIRALTYFVLPGMGILLVLVVLVLLLKKLGRSRRYKAPVGPKPPVSPPPRPVSVSRPAPPARPRPAPTVSTKSPWEPKPAPPVSAPPTPKFEKGQLPCGWNESCERNPELFTPNQNHHDRDALDAMFRDLDESMHED